MQGGAEVYPVSSSAQLTLLPWLTGWEPPGDRTRFAAGLHLGSTAGLALALREDLRALRPAEARRLALSAGPAAVAGLLLHEVVERRLGSPRRTAALMAVSAAALWVTDRQAESGDPRTLARVRDGVRAGTAAGTRDHGKAVPARGGTGFPRSREVGGKAVPARGGTGFPRSREVGGRDLVTASLAQVASLAPGVSRSGVTLTALRARGVEREQALRTSLLMSLPVTVGAAGLTAVRGRARPPLVPTALAGLSAYAAARRVPPARRVVAVSVAYRLVVAAAVPVVARTRRKRAHA